MPEVLRCLTCAIAGGPREDYVTEVVASPADRWKSCPWEDYRCKASSDSIWPWNPGSETENLNICGWHWQTMGKMPLTSTGERSSFQKERIEAKKSQGRGRLMCVSCRASPLLSMQTHPTLRVCLWSLFPLPTTLCASVSFQNWSVPILTRLSQHHLYLKLLEVSQPITSEDRGHCY